MFNSALNNSISKQQLPNLAANLNLSNITATGKNTSVDWGVPKYNSGIAITYPDSSHKYTAPKDGIVVLFNFWEGAGNFTTQTILYINNVATSFRGQSSTSYYENGNGTLSIFVSKGDVVYLSRSARSVGNNVFYPLKGAS